MGSVILYSLINILSPFPFYQYQNPSLVFWRLKEQEWKQTVAEAWVDLVRFPNCQAF